MKRGTNEIAPLRAKVEAAMRDVHSEIAKRCSDGGNKFSDHFMIDGLCKHCGTAVMTSVSTEGCQYEFLAWSSLADFVRRGHVGQKTCDCVAKLAEAAA